MPEPEIGLIMIPDVSYKGLRLFMEAPDGVNEEHMQEQVSELNSILKGMMHTVDALKPKSREMALKIIQEHIKKPVLAGAN